MSWLIFCLEIVAFAYAVPPIVPHAEETLKVDLQKLLPIASVFSKHTNVDELVGASYKCVDGVNNVIEVGNAKGNLRIQAKDVTLQTYDKDGNPSCYKGNAQIAIPGKIKIMNGTVVVTAPSSQLFESLESRLTLAKNSFFVGTVCKDGKENSMLLPKGSCGQDLSSKDRLFYITRRLSTPGTYTIQEMIRLLYMKMTIELESLNGALKFGVDGEWKAALSLFSEGQEVAALKFPSNTEWVHVD
ncbi:hypothetical protein OESDEN_14244 [Oesophagostomum dentatum]|uniref:Uncharacterized protein n=1 Tax=Oesophagostomum dentatum TaxID=61180 RepID=A0A0B1SL08_OESDE|nr:hypothetical protein OESDEN_14244 [Oesophagostomum dentatum]